MASTEPRDGPSDPSSAPERFDLLVEQEGVLIERITSFGNTTPPDRLYRQDHAEWVMVVEGVARVRLDGDAEDQLLGPEDNLLVPADRYHWVTYTADPTVWIAVHLPTAGEDGKG